MSEKLPAITNETFKKEVLEASKDKLILVDFWAPWCGPCRMLTPVLEEMSEDTDLQERVSIVSVNADDNNETASEYQVQGIPTMMYFYNGKPVHTSVGALPKEAILQEIEAAEKAAKEGKEDKED